MIYFEVMSLHICAYDHGNGCYQLTLNIGTTVLKVITGFKIAASDSWQLQDLADTFYLNLQYS